MNARVFLGGSCSCTTWRKEVAIPMLDGAGIAYFDPQIPAGEWTASRCLIETRELARCDVALWVITGTTRSVASLAEAACYVAEGRPIALMMEMIGEESLIEGMLLTAAERDDLNRGRIFLNGVASDYKVPIFGNVADATRHAIQLCVSRRPGVTMVEVGDALERVRCRDYRFVTIPVRGGFFLQVETVVEDIKSGQPAGQRGRKWYLDSHSSIDDVIRTAFKAIATWEEHELRERFLVDGRAVFGPHSSILEAVQESP